MGASIINMNKRIVTYLTQVEAIKLAEHLELEALDEHPDDRWCYRVVESPFASGDKTYTVAVYDEFGDYMGVL